LSFDDKKSAAMAPSIPSADSIQLARSILDAWSARDSRRLQSALRDADNVPSWRFPTHPLESERRELVSSVGEQIRRDLLGSCRPVDSKALAVWMDLLRNIVIGNA
jgi:hypothetical protein